jgi:hypothetical protein
MMFHDMQTTKGVVYHAPCSGKVTKVVSIHTHKHMLNVSGLAVFVCLFLSTWLRRIEGRTFGADQIGASCDLVHKHIVLLISFSCLTQFI